MLVAYKLVGYKKFLAELVSFYGKQTSNPDA